MEQASLKSLVNALSCNVSFLLVYMNDVFHLSYIGNDIFINALQSPLQLFIKYPQRTLYADELC